MDLKQFWQKQAEHTISWCQLDKDKNDLGLFFWERGGKQYVEDCYWSEDKCNSVAVSAIPTLRNIIAEAKRDNKHNDADAHDFLDALVCLGEDKIKELIKELGV